MSAAELDQEILEALAPLASAPVVNVLLGAGASAAVGLPNWDTLATRLLQRSGAVPEEDTARAFLAHQDPQLAAETARRRVDDWHELLRECLYDPGAGVTGEAPLTPGVLHLAVAALAAGREVGDVGLFTLNFDPLLEVALEQVSDELGQDRGVFSRAMSAPRAPRGHYEVHHLHGLLQPGPGGRVEGVVLTLSDFTELDAQARPWQVAALQTALEHGPLVLAGTSYRDPDIRRWMHQLTAGATTSGSAVVILLARASMGLSRERFAEVKEAVAEQWSAIGVSAVLMQDHADAAQALRELPELGNPGYHTPRQRAEDLLGRHLRDFEHLQAEHAEQLEEDLAALRPHLGADANLTLWLANGHGDLVRWAANDRVHRGSRHLRSVPSGHDSPWVAGECLGSDALIIRELANAESTRRWRSVVATPVVVQVPGGPPFSAAALSSATSTLLGDDERTDAWSLAMEQLSQQWSERLEALG